MTTIPFAKRGIDVTVWPQAKIVQPDRISIGSHVIIDDFCFIVGGKKTEIGDYVHMASFASSTGGGELFIGDFCSIAQGVSFLTGTDDYTGTWGGLPNPTIPARFRNPKRYFIRMEKHAMVGQGARVFPGVTLGEGCTVGAMSLVLKDLPPWTICTGIPARPVKDKPRETILRLEKELREWERSVPTVSVMVMAYNQERFIRQTIDRILEQKTDFIFEVIVHDDASTDSTPAIIREYAEQFPNVVKPVFQKINQFKRTGLYPTIYFFEKARGRYIAECDGDDYWTDPRKLQKQVDFMDAHPEASLCHHAYMISEKGVMRVPGREVPRDYTPEELIGFQIAGYGIGSCTKLYRNYYSEATRADYERLVGDYPMNVLLGMHGSAKYIPDIEPSVYRRMNGTNTWCSLPGTIKQQKTREMHKRIYDLMVEKENPRWIQLRRAFL